MRSSFATTAWQGLMFWFSFLVSGSVIQGCSSGQGHPGQTLLALEKQRGVNFAHIHRRGHGYGSDAAAAELDSLHALGVRWIAITPFGYQHDATADEITGYPGHEGRSEFFGSTDPSMTDDDLTRQVSDAHALGLHVTLKPHLWSRDFWHQGEWQGSIRQASDEQHARWWKSYRAFMLHYAELAEATATEQLCIGTELINMTTAHPDEWRTLIRDIRTVYGGALTYAAHWAAEFSAITFWDAIDYIGINEYFPLDVPDTASVEDLVRAWGPRREVLRSLAERYGKPIIFMEAGFRAGRSCFRKPWADTRGPRDDDCQSRGYEALFRTFGNERWWNGVYFWKSFTDPDMIEKRGSDPFSFRRHQAQDVLQQWFSPPAGEENLHPRIFPSW
jgi:hypothetical protein